MSDDKSKYEEKIENAALVVTKIEEREKELWDGPSGSNRKRLWKNSFIKHQIDKRDGGTDKNKSVVSFPINDHIKGMVYSMLSSNAHWSRLEKDIDADTGEIAVINEIFDEYDPCKLKEKSLKS